MPQDLKQRTEEPEQQEIAQGQQFASNPPGAPGTPSRRKNRKLPVQVQSKRGGVLDPFTSQLVAWVVSGCGDAEWRALVAKKRHTGAPPWLDGDRLGLDDLSHRILLLAIAHLVHTQGAIELSPFEGREDLDGECLIKHLSLPAPAGAFQVAQRLAVDAPLRTRGYIHVENEWSTRRGRGNEVSVSVAKFLRTDLSLTISALGPLLGLANAEEAQKEPGLDGLVLPQTVRHTLNRFLHQPPPLNKPFWVFLKGPAQSGRRTLAQALTKQFGQTLRPTCMCDGPQPGNCILVELFSTTDEDDWANIKDHPGWIFIRPREQGLRLKLENRADLVLDLGALETESRLGFWTDRLHDLGGQFASIDPAEMAALDAPPGKVVETLQKVVQAATWSDMTAAGMKSRLKELLAVSTEDTQEQQYATRVIPERTIDELCLEPEAMARFQRILKSIRGRSEMLSRWNLDPGLVGRAKGVLLFHGPSGTGKSMAAEVLAHELKIPLLRVESTELETPFVGETESRIHNFMTSTKGKPAFLLWDEADSVRLDQMKEAIKGGFEDRHGYVAFSVLAWAEFDPEPFLAGTPHPPGDYHPNRFGVWAVVNRLDGGGRVAIMVLGTEAMGAISALYPTTPPKGLVIQEHGFYCNPWGSWREPLTHYANEHWALPPEWLILGDHSRFDHPLGHYEPLGEDLAVESLHGDWRFIHHLRGE